MKLFSKHYTVPINKLLKQIFTGLITVWTLHLAVTSFYFSKLTGVKSEKYLALELFFFEFEKNIPTLFSAFLLLFCGHLLLTLHKENKSVFTKGLGYVFVFLACDEWFCIHETLNQVEISYLPSWVFFYLPLAIIVTVFSIPFLKSLPKKMALLTVSSGIIYAFGSVVFELSNITFASFNFNDPLFQLLLFLEDGSEMSGAFLFIVTVLMILKKQYNYTHLQLPTWPLLYLCLFGILDIIISY